MHAEEKQEACKLRRAEAMNHLVEDEDLVARGLEFGQNLVQQREFACMQHTTRTSGSLASSTSQDCRGGGTAPQCEVEVNSNNEPGTHKMAVEGGCEGQNQ